MAIRSPAKWMECSDDRILEYLDDRGVSSVTTIDESEFVDYHYNTIGRRLRLLSKANLVERIGQGVYRITTKGEGYLNGDEDLRDEPKPE